MAHTPLAQTRKLSTPALVLALGASLFLSSPAAPAQAANPAGTGATQGAQPIGKKHLYSETADPRADITQALQQAKREHKRVLLDFGGDWCGDCQVLDIYFHQEPNGALLEKNFVVVHVFIGHMDKNLDLASHYGVPISRGVPALAVIDAKGKVLHAQGTGEFSDMRYMDAASVTEFLNKWKG